MKSLPPALCALIEIHMQTLLHWFSGEVYRRMLGRGESHFLVRLAKRLDFRPLEEVCASYHHSGGAGAPVTHSVPRLVRALLVKYLLNLSLRQLEETIRWNLLVKWFVGYALFEAGPDHTTLERFELWVYAHHPRDIFDRILNQIDEDFPAEREKAQIGDTYALRANAAGESLIHLVRHSCQRLLNALGEATSEGLAEVQSQLEQEVLFGRTEETQEYRLKPEEKEQRLYQTVKAAIRCQELVQARLSSQTEVVAEKEQAVHTWLAILAKILADELTIGRDENGQVTQVKPLPKAKKGLFRIASASDPDATYRVHGDDIDLGYNVNLAATDTFIREIRADTGSQHDATAIPDLLSAQQKYHNLLPSKFIYDQAAGTGKSHVAVATVSQGRTQLVAPLVDYSQRSQRFGPDDFSLSPDGHSLTCPNGQVSSSAYRSNSSDGRLFRFTPHQCQECPLTQACRGDQLPPNQLRRIYISDYRSALDDARTYAQTPEFQQDLSLRAGIERIISNLVCFHDARQARRRGQPSCDFQAKMNATAFNIRQWLRLLERRTPASASP